MKYTPSSQKLFILFIAMRKLTCSSPEQIRWEKEILECVVRALKQNTKLTLLTIQKILASSDFLMCSLSVVYISVSASVLLLILLNSPAYSLEGNMFI